MWRLRTPIKPDEGIVKKEPITMIIFATLIHYFCLSFKQLHNLSWQPIQNISTLCNNFDEKTIMRCQIISREALTITQIAPSLNRHLPSTIIKELRSQPIIPFISMLVQDQVAYNGIVFKKNYSFIILYFDQALMYLFLNIGNKLIVLHIFMLNPQSHQHHPNWHIIFWIYPQKLEQGIISIYQKKLKPIIHSSIVTLNSLHHCKAL